VRMQWLMLQQEKPEDFVIATGVQYSVRQFIEKTATALGMQMRWESSGVTEVGYAVIASEARQSMPLCPTDQPIIRIDPRYFRPTEVETLLGDPSKAKHKLGWEPEITLDQMISEMTATDLKEAKKHALLKRHGFHINVSLE
jgi:GDPmannose 4,6-dehydratase